MSTQHGALAHTGVGIKRADKYKQNVVEVAPAAAPVSISENPQTVAEAQAAEIARTPQYRPAPSV